MLVCVNTPTGSMFPPFPHRLCRMVVLAERMEAGIHLPWTQPGHNGDTTVPCVARVLLCVDKWGEDERSTPPIKRRKKKRKTETCQWKIAVTPPSTSCFLTQLLVSVILLPLLPAVLLLLFFQSILSSRARFLCCS